MADEKNVKTVDEEKSEKDGVGTKIKNLFKKGGRFIKRNWKPFAAGVGTVIGGSLVASLVGGDSNGVSIELPSGEDGSIPIPETPLEPDILID